MINYQKAPATVFTLSLLAACGGNNTTSPMVVERGPSSSAGYATEDSAIYLSGQEISTTVTLTELNDASNTAQLIRLDAGVSPDADDDAFTINIAGEDIFVTWYDSSGTYYGDNGASSIQLIPLRSTDSDQASLFWAFFQPDLNDDDIRYFGPSIAGITSAPAQIDAITGTVEYNGYGIVGMMATDRSAYAAAEGDLEVTVSFTDDGEVDGTLELREIPRAREGDFAIQDTTLTFETDFSGGNGFETTFDVDAADLGLTETSNETVEGTFYGYEGSDLGGVLYADGQTSDGRNVVINGAFLGER